MGDASESGVAQQQSARVDAFSRGRRVLFCEALAASGNVRHACTRAGVSVETVYRLRRRDELFAAAWDGALVLSIHAAEAELADRALNGVEEAVFFRGEQVGTRRRHDSRLLLAHLARLDARATHPHAPFHAGRFDELLALVGGERSPVPRFASERIEDATVAYHADCSSPALPESRELHRATSPDPDDAARRWDQWQRQARASVDARLHAAPPPPAAAPSESPLEFKSLDATAPRAGTVSTGVNFWTNYGMVSNLLQRRESRLRPFPAPPPPGVIHAIDNRSQIIASPSKIYKSTVRI